MGPHPEHVVDRDGGKLTFRFEEDETDTFRNIDGNPVPAPDGLPYRVKGKFIREAGKLVPDPGGRPFRLWRPALDPNLLAAYIDGTATPDISWTSLDRGYSLS